MTSTSEHRSRAHRLGGASLARFIRLVRATSTVIVEPPDGLDRVRQYHPSILTCWHGQFLMVPAVAPPGMPMSVMVARHGDAEFLSEAIRHFGHGLIRGAGAGARGRDRGGASALRAAVAALGADTSIAMTTDVPPGPARKAGLGIITLARLSGRPIVPTGFASSRAVALRTWSRFTINFPYSRVAVVIGEPMLVARNASAEAQEAARQRLEEALMAASHRAHAMVGTELPALAGRQGRIGRDAPLPFGLRAYRRVTGAGGPLARALLSWRARRGKEDPLRMAERQGIASRDRPDGPLAWVHAASVGEVNAILPLIGALRRQRPDVGVLLTSGTVTSAGLAAERLPPGCIHQYVPLDVPAYVRRFLEHWRPDVALLTESELWPNLILETAARGIRLGLLNARMSARSFARWRRRPAMAHALLGRFDLVLAQTDKLARRLGELGATGARSIGNLKIDSPALPVDEAARAALAGVLGTRARILAASTHAGEEQIVAQAHRQVAEVAPGLLTIIAPRHPARGAEIARDLEAQGFRVALRSSGALPDRGTEIYIADTIGELGTLFAISPVAFMGGSLIEHGGQNPIEAVRSGSVVLTGPHVDNFADTYRALMRQKGAREVKDAAALAAAAGELLASPQALAEMGRRGREALATLAGALPRTLDAVLALLDRPAAELERAS